MKLLCGLLVLVTTIFSVDIAYSQSGKTSVCSATLKNNLLILENNLISRVYQWNSGNIISQSITDKASGKTWLMNSGEADLILPGEAVKATNALFENEVVAETAIAPQHLQARVTYTLGSIEIKRVFRIYPDCAAIACDLYYRGVSSNNWVQEGANIADMVNLEKLTSANASATAPVIEKVTLPGKHWHMNTVEFFDVTDRFNNLVRSVKSISYRPNTYRGNLLLATDQVTGKGVFILKEAPASSVQLAYSGSDFITDFGTFRVVGAGISPSDLDRSEWKRGYGFVTGLFSGDERNGMIALRNYQRNLRLHKPGRDEMVLMNTWGDRGQDTRIRESFAFAELEAGAKLGITHFQLDDGWQTGRTTNSAFKGGSLENIWNNPLFWEPNTERFPNGLAPVVEKGRQLGIEICLWFNPSSDNSNENWERDANTLIGLYKKYGIRTYKIDGVRLPDKTAELNFRKFLDKVNRECDNNVVFNLDVTARRRGGYHYFKEYGNLFLENRYTDWQNYYPYMTLRNLWMLSGYVPPQTLQIEFLNKWRNAEKYGDDPFAPLNYSFEYLFAITMAAQPLCWFEGTGLPKDAVDKAAPLIRKYREIQSDLHSGNIFPIGDEPSGKSWTGFQSIQEGKGYFIVFRESNDHDKYEFKTWLKPGTIIRSTVITGEGKSFSAKVGAEGRVSFSLPERNSYALYKYSVN